MLAADRRRGYVISHSNFEAGIASIAAPIFDAKGEVVGAINVSTPENAIDAQHVRHGRLRRAARGRAPHLGTLGLSRGGGRFVNLELSGRVAVVTGGTSGHRPERRAPLAR